MQRNTLTQYKVTHRETQLHIACGMHRFTITDTTRHLNAHSYTKIYSYSQMVITHMYTHST